MLSRLIYITVNNHVLTAELVENSSADHLLCLLNNGPINLEMSDYGNFEKVGGFGRTFPTNNEQISTHAGDLILY